MDSRLAREARDAQFAAMQRLTVEQRLKAFLQHCQLMMALQLACPLKRSIPKSPQGA
jgi:hypothetical protein